MIQLDSLREPLKILFRLFLQPIRPCVLNLAPYMDRLFIMSTPQSSLCSERESNNTGREDLETGVITALRNRIRSC